ncbi:glycosyltransferase [Pseudonocardia benzenivorans]|uniref:Glycosyltransferase n=1 Tax=Pseudonocardia benzenivorans TaxID=228005 RepID=A0ABW3VQZ2_9PSEU|nr:glycosyl transferase [Pseudonocardia sp. D17]
MRVLIAAPGSRGDVVGFVGLGRRLASAGHEVTVAANPEFEQTVRVGGVAFRRLAGDARTIADLGTGPRSSLRFLTEQAEAMTTYLCGAADDLVEAAAHADVLLVTMTAQFGVDVAEGHAIPSAGLFSRPVEPTRAFPPVLFHTARSLGPAGNLVAGELARLSTTPFHRASAHVRAVMGLPRRSPVASLRRLCETRWPVWHGWSPHVLPRPVDWRPGLEVVGYWYPYVPDSWEPPADLAAFLQAGPAPVYVGFGSMGPGQGERLSSILAEALRRSGTRAVVGRGWAGLEVAGDDVLVVDDVPHSWLFPRTAAVVPRRSPAGSPRP